MESAISVKDVGLTIKKDVILSDINVEFERGKIHGLIGRNGSGKTMLMKCICGFVRPTKGHVIFDGKRIGKDTDFPENAGIIIETPGFIPYYSGYRNLKIYILCSEPSSKILCISSLRRIRHITSFKNMLVNASIHRIF